jgi:hypothetical protein
VTPVKRAKNVLSTFVARPAKPKLNAALFASLGRQINAAEETALRAKPVQADLDSALLRRPPIAEAVARAVGAARVQRCWVFLLQDYWRGVVSASRLS